MPLPVAVPDGSIVTVTVFPEAVFSDAVIVATPAFSANGLPDKPKVTVGAASLSVMV